MKKTNVILMLLIILPGLIFPQTFGKASFISSAAIEKLSTQYIEKEGCVIKFISDVDTLLNMKPLSVTQKSFVPPSGDPHDFVSMGTYWWPDSSKPGGVPYIRKDGNTNPEIWTIPDNVDQKKVISAVEKLAIAYGITKDEKYSRKAAQLLRAWFIDEKTKMNPNLNFGQFIKGVNNGRSSGIIDTYVYYIVCNVMGILETSPEWKKEEDAKLKEWFREYQRWLTTTKLGLGEKAAENNHGTWYDVQVVSIALLINDMEYAKEILRQALTVRLAKQIGEDGGQEMELERTKSWTYSVFNLRSLYVLARLAENAGVDFWHYGDGSKPLLQKALDFLLPSAVNPGKWKYEQLESIKPAGLYPLILIAAEKYDRETYSGWLQKIFGDDCAPDLTFLSGAF